MRFTFYKLSSFLRVVWRFRNFGLEASEECYFWKLAFVFRMRELDTGA